MLKEFIDYLEDKQGKAIYVWGGQGQIASETWIRQHETSRANANRAIALYQKRKEQGYSNIEAYDCSGLGMHFLHDIKYIYSFDMSANSMMKKCLRIVSSELKKGDWVFRTYKSGIKTGEAYHVGYIVSDTLDVIESKGRDDGVVRCPLSASGMSYWNAFGRPQCFKDDIESGDVIAFSRLLKNTGKPYMSGLDIKSVQYALKENGFDPGIIDGCYGPFTERAVIAYQRSARLKADGIVGPYTWTSLGLAV